MDKKAVRCDRGSGLGTRFDRQHTVGREKRRLGGQLAVSSFRGFVIDPSSFWLRADELAFTYRDVREKAGGKFGGVHTFAESRIAFVVRD